MNTLKACTIIITVALITFIFISGLFKVAELIAKYILK